MMRVSVRLWWMILTLVSTVVVFRSRLLLLEDQEGSSFGNSLHVHNGNYDEEEEQHVTPPDNETKATSLLEDFENKYHIPKSHTKEPDINSKETNDLATTTTTEDYGPSSCRFHLEDYLAPLQRTWQKAKVPMLHQIVTVNQTAFVFFARAHINDASFRGATWTSHYNGGLLRDCIVVPSASLILKCPNIDLIDSISLNSTTRIQHYDTRKLIQCQEEIHNKESPPPNTTIGACTSIKRERNWKLLLPWIEYHKMIGIQHFWIYVNEPLTDQQWGGDYLPKRKYITYVPMDFTKAAKRPHFHQLMIQNECIYRSRNYGLKWLAIHDVDEYFHITLSSNNSNLLPDLHRLIHSIPKDQIAGSGGLQFKNWFYGNGPNRSTTTTIPFHTIPLDYVNRLDTYDSKGREKLLVRPNHVDFVAIHYVASGKPPIVLDPSTQGFQNHYKLAKDGVYRPLSSSQVALEPETEIGSVV